jgi:hypothetical protein
MADPLQPYTQGNTWQTYAPTGGPAPTTAPGPAPAAPTGNPWDVQGAWTPANRTELVNYAGANGWSEDFDRFKDEAGVQDWIKNYWDPNARKFRSAKTDAQGNALEGFVEKPDETPDGWMAWGDHAIRSADGQQRMAGWGGGGEAGGGGAGGYGSSSGFTSNVPQFNFTRFRAPNPQDIYRDPSYQFRLNEGNRAIEGSQAAKGLLRTGGTLKDLMGYGQDLASQEYGNAYNRALQGWGANFEGEKAQFAPQYGAWSTQYGGDLSRWTTNQNAALSKYLQREGNIYGLINTPEPSAPTYG